MCSQILEALPKAPPSHDKETNSTTSSSSGSTPSTSLGTSTQEPAIASPVSTRPARKAVRQGMAKRVAVPADDTNNEVDSAPDFKGSSDDIEESSEPSRMVIDSGPLFNEDGTEDDFNQPQPKTLKSAEKTKSATIKVLGKKPRKDNSNAVPCPAQDNYGSALNLALPPISNISDIFLDLTANALRATEDDPTRVGKGNGKKGQVLETITHDLNDVLKHLNGRKLRVATMCSGTESPLLALQLVNDALKSLGKNLEIEHLFSAEIVPHKQAYIERNFSPSIIFRDITEMSAENAFEATTAYGAKVPIPGGLDLLVAGFSCVDHSNLNVNKQEMKENAESKKAAKLPSESGDTMYALLDYIEGFRPRMVIMENVIGAPWAKLVPYLEERRYSARYARCDSKRFYIPHTRQRGYLFCVNRDLFNNSEAADKVVNMWETLMVKFQRPASSPVEDFLLSENDSRLILGRQELENTRVERSQRKTVDWRKCLTRHFEERLELSLGQKRPVTAWVEGGLCKGPDYMWVDWLPAQVERVWDTIDINFLRTYLSKGFDNQYKARIIDLSQNVDRNIDSARSGVTSCLTPSGIPFSTLRGGPVLGIESLALQGLPVDKLQIAMETQAKLQDLAGNAMTSTVVGAAQLSALISAFGILPRGSDADMDNSAPPYYPAVCHMHDVQEVKLGLGDYTPLDVAQACDAAARSVRLCSCEDNFGVSRAYIQECSDCMHTTCKSCGSNPQHNYVPRPAIERISPSIFQHMITAALPMKVTMTGLSPEKMQELKISIEQLSTLSKVQQQMTWEAFRSAFASELRFCSQADRSEIWIFSYDSRHAHMKLLISSKQVEWQLFAKSPTQEPVNSPLRKLLENPILRMFAAGFDLTKGDWELRLPVTHSFTAVIEGKGPLVPSYGHQIGLGPFQDSKVFSQYSVSVDKALNDRAGTEVGGSYKLLPKCGTASGALHIQSETAKSGRPMFMFLDPDRLGKPNKDSFVLSEDKRRFVKGKRSTIARIDSTWRPDILMETSTAEGLTKLSKLEIWEKGKGAAKTHQAHLSEYVDGPKSVVFHVDGLWIKVLGAELNSGNDAGIFMAAGPAFQLRSSLGSCQEAHVVLHCEAQVQPGELSYWKKVELVDKINEGPFFTSFWWLIGKAKSFYELSQWQEVVGSSSQHCQNCSPATPRIMWKLGKDDKLIPFERHQDAANFELNLRNRAWPVVSEIQVHDDGTVVATLSINPETLMHRAAYSLRTSPYNNIDMDWRLLTDHSGLAPLSFPKLRLQSNQDGPEANQPPSFKKYQLRSDQLRSLHWMIGQEEDPSAFMEEEVEERVVSQLGWRLEGRATKFITVRGGVLADHVGFGKTATTLALIDTHRQQDALTSRVPVRGRISVKATLILVPTHLTEQWKSEIEKFLCGQHKYKVLVITKIGDLAKQTIATFQDADIIIVSWKICEHEGYLFKVAQFTGSDELPSKWSNRAGCAWYKRALAQIAPHVDELQRGGKHLLEIIDAKLQKNQQEVTDATAGSLVPSKRLTGAKYRESKLQLAQKKRKRPEDEEIEGEESDSPAAKSKKRAAAKKSEAAKKRGDVFNLASIASGNSHWTNMRSPLLEMFEFSRIVVDEYTYATGKEGMVIPNLQARSHWILSGTPPLEDFADVKTISRFLGIRLGVDDMTPGVTKTLNSKKLAKDLTSAEKFQSYTVAHSYSWHETRHELAQHFLNQFVRQNLVDYNAIPASGHWMPVSLPVAERVVYLELQSVIAANRGQLPKDTEDHYNDRDERIKDSAQTSTNAGEALIKRASYFTVNGTNLTLSSGVHALESLIKLRKLHYRGICIDFKKKAAVAEAVQDALEQECKQYSVSKHRISSLAAGDREAAIEIRSLFSEVAGKSDNSKLLEPKDEITNRNLRELANNLDKASDNVVRAMRGLRLVQSVRSFKDDAQDENICSVCKMENLSHNDAFILVNCGHIVCDHCLHSSTREDMDDVCPAPFCKAVNTDHQIISPNEVSHHHGNMIPTSYYGKKLEEVVDLVNNIPDSEQILMFVQYVDIIEKVGHALKQQKITYATISDNDDSARVLKNFQTDMSTSRSKVLILNIGSASAAGSNLTNANHVIFLSPYHTNSAQSYTQAIVQAAARSRRHGQKKHVQIYSFFSLKTIEVDTIEHREEMILTEGFAQQHGLKLPYEGFIPSSFGLDVRQHRFHTHGPFRSESSTCVDEGDLLEDEDEM